MRFSTFSLIAAVAATGSAQNLGNIPKCALACFAAAIPSSGCSITDQKCLCTTGADSITDSLAKCVPGKCSDDEMTKLIPAVEDLCKEAGVTLSNIPTAVASATGSATKATKTEASATESAASATSAAAETPGAAVANGVGMGAVVLGVAAAFL